MNTLTDKLFLMVGSFLLLLFRYPQPDLPHVLALLCAVTFVCLYTYANPDMLPLKSQKRSTLYLELSLAALFIIGCFLQPFLVPFLPLLFYELVLANDWYLCGIVLICAFVHAQSQPFAFLILYLLLFLLAFALKSKAIRLLHLERDFKQLRDTSTEYNLLLQQKNQELIKQQDYEIRVATLKERNRIAREIHDNVGHMLSRSILQAGALIAINKDEQLKEPLVSLKDTLSLAMTSIRESVHDLHDDSVDLKSSLYTLIQDFTDYEVHMEYDMGTVLPKNIKYCFIAIAKEALSNISKHSNATRIRIVAREHPSFFQLLVEDNGTDISVQNSGIGLENMQERVEQLHGRFSFSTEQGFRIFISIPKA